MITNSKTQSQQIVTASWFTALPSHYVRVGISRGTPRAHPAGYRRYRTLAPGSWFNSVPDEEYVRRYTAEVLAPLSSKALIADLLRISGGSPVALLCFERCQTDDGWCHRGLVARYLEHEAGLQIHEYGFDHLGYGVKHPMLPPHLLCGSPSPPDASARAEMMSLKIKFVPYV